MKSKARTPKKRTDDTQKPYVYYENDEEICIRLSKEQIKSEGRGRISKHYAVINGKEINVITRDAYYGRLRRKREREAKALLSTGLPYTSQSFNPEEKHLMTHTIEPSSKRLAQGNNHPPVIKPLAINRLVYEQYLRNNIFIATMQPNAVSIQNSASDPFVSLPASSEGNIDSNTIKPPC